MKTSTSSVLRTSSWVNGCSIPPLTPCDELWTSYPSKSCLYYYKRVQYGRTHGQSPRNGPTAPPVVHSGCFSTFQARLPKCPYTYPKVNVSVDHLELLIELVRQHPCIYDHKDAFRVAIISASICRVLQEDYQDMTGEWGID